MRLNHDLTASLPFDAMNAEDDARLLRIEALSAPGELVMNSINGKARIATKTEEPTGHGRRKAHRLLDYEPGRARLHAR